MQTYKNLEKKIDFNFKLYTVNKMITLLFNITAVAIPFEKRKKFILIKKFTKKKTIFY